MSVVGACLGKGVVLWDFLRRGEPTTDRTERIKEGFFCDAAVVSAVVIVSGGVAGSCFNE